MPSISLKDFICTGEFGKVVAGMTRVALEKELGSPEARDTGSRKHPYPTIWKYGDIEFFFEQYRRDGKLKMIYADDFEEPTGWGELRIDPWIIRGEMAQYEVERMLLSEGVDFRNAETSFPNEPLIVTSTGVALGFTQEGNNKAASLACLYKKFPTEE